MNELQEALDRIFNNCEEIDNHNPIEEQTGYKMIEDIKLLGKGINDLQQRIDKAIEYLKYSNPAHWGSENEIELLVILKGSEK